MLLTIDAGNTRTKWAIFDRDGEIMRHGACMNEQLSAAEFNQLTLGCKRIVISNVAGKEHAAKLEKLLAPLQLPLFWVKAGHEACNVINSYLMPETLGTDRWAALIAAWHIKHAPCVIVNAGTAVTIDALQAYTGNDPHGKFIGGMILPGLMLMRNSLGLGTAQLPAGSTVQQTSGNAATDVFAKSTAEAIHTGTLHAITGAIAGMATALETQCDKTPFIILSGGDAPLIQTCLTDAVTNPTLIVDNLVLKGLYLLDRSEQ